MYRIHGFAPLKIQPKSSREVVALLQVAAMSAGLANLLQMPQGVWGCGTIAAGGRGGQVSGSKLWNVGELEFEALMRMLDNKVRDGT